LFECDPEITAVQHNSYVLFFFANATAPDNLGLQQLIQLANQMTEKIFLIVFPYSSVSYRSIFTLSVNMCYTGDFTGGKWSG